MTNIAGVDEFASITLKYSGERVAQLSCSIGVDLINEAVVYGTKGMLKLPRTFWCPTKLETSDVSAICMVLVRRFQNCVYVWPIVLCVCLFPF